MSKRFVSGERCVTDILFHSTDSKRYCGRVSTVNDVGLGSRLKDLAWSIRSCILKSSGRVRAARVKTSLRFFCRDKAICMFSKEIESLRFLLKIFWISLFCNPLGWCLQWMYNVFCKPLQLLVAEGLSSRWTAACLKIGISLSKELPRFEISWSILDPVTV